MGRSSPSPARRWTRFFGYTGRFFDDDTGLQWNTNRWYDPGVGRWLSEDPIGFAGGDPNLYRYVANSPGAFVDPDGLDSMAIAAASNQGTFEREDACREVPLTCTEFASRFGLWLNANERWVLSKGCVGVMSISIMKQSSGGAEQVRFNANQAKLLQDRARYFTKYEAAKAYYESLRADGKSPALFGFAANSRPLSREQIESQSAHDGNNTNSGPGTGDARGVPGADSLLPSEVPWTAIISPGDNFDYVTLAKIDPVYNLKGRRSPHWLHANHCEPNMKVLITPAEMWTDGRRLIWVVVEAPDAIWKRYDLSFDIPETPWKVRPPEWGSNDYGQGETPPFPNE